MKLQTLDTPSWIDTGKASDAFYYPDYALLQEKAIDFRKQHAIKPASGDIATSIIHLGIDWQRDFGHPEGSLYVAGQSGTGAIDAARNSADFRWKYLPMIQEMVCTMDTHLPLQVFFPTVHQRTDGQPIAPHTIITADEYANAVYEANPRVAKEFGMTPATLTKQFKFYTRELEKIDPITGEPKYSLYMWPFHCMLGSWGHSLIGVIDEVRMMHALLRYASNIPEIKGGSPLSEMFSIFCAEVMTFFNGDPLPEVQKNVALIEKLLGATMVILDGLASSHCLKESINDFDKELTPELAKKIYIMKNCSAAVVTPAIDFTPQADAAYERWASKGMNIVESTTPMEDWPGVADLLQLQ